MPLKPIPLGKPIPPSPHAISCSLPTMRSIIGYEEKDPEILQTLETGYPRFVTHPILSKLRDHFFPFRDLAGKSVWFTADLAAAREMAHVVDGHRLTEVKELPGGVGVVRHPRDPELDRRARRYLQSTGRIISSRRAVDLLVAEGVMEKPFEEELIEEESFARKTITETMGKIHGGVPAENILLAANGMNAFFETFNVLSRKQAGEGRFRWIQLGWLYTDTMTILNDFEQAPGPGKVERFYDVLGTDELLAFIKEHAGEIAGLVTECPTNPLLQTGDLESIAKAVHEAGGLMILDPTLASPYNIDVTPVADVILNSLTKFAGNGGDVLMGSVVFPAGREKTLSCKEEIAAALVSPYEKDVRRLAVEIGDYENLMADANRSAAKVIEWLLKRPEVARVYWTGQSRCAEHYARFRRPTGGVGAVFSIALKKNMRPFYDALRFPKGPSFGMQNSLVCPFMYLAHYDLVSSKEGQRFLLEKGIPFSLLRFSIGREPVEELIEALEEAFDLAAKEIS
ncbi:MAG: PLP-dependent transferase [Opitutales bacterium]|nr:PLP-dependent transferase [Opitutales bacterium]